jgi:hypothetical protein
VRGLRRLCSRVVRWANRADVTGLFGSAAIAARQAASRRAGRPRPKIGVLAPGRRPRRCPAGTGASCGTSDGRDRQPVAADDPQP